MITEQYLIDKYLGIPYKKNGRNLAEGIDCQFLVISVYRDLGYELLDLESSNWLGHELHKVVVNYYKGWEPVAKPQLFDVAIFSDHRNRYHGGVTLSNNKVLHTCSQGTIVTKWTTGCWQQKLQGFFHLKARNDTA
jgi:cell wall-associated NlpC family hydrolase